MSDSWISTVGCIYKLFTRCSPCGKALVESCQKNITTGAFESEGCSETFLAKFEFVLALGNINLIFVLNA